MVTLSKTEFQIQKNLLSCKIIDGSRDKCRFFSIIGLINKTRSWNKKNIKKYIEIYIKSDVKKIISLNKKKIYKSKKNIVGINIRPQFPKNLI